MITTQDNSDTEKKRAKQRTMEQDTNNALWKTSGGIPPTETTQRENPIGSTKEEVSGEKQLIIDKVKQREKIKKIERKIQTIRETELTNKAYTIWEEYTKKKDDIYTGI